MKNILIIVLLIMLVGCDNKEGSTDNSIPYDTNKEQESSYKYVNGIRKYNMRINGSKELVLEISLYKLEPPQVCAEPGIEVVDENYIYSLTNCTNAYKIKYKDKLYNGSGVIDLILNDTLPVDLVVEVGYPLEVLVAKAV